MTIYEGLLEVPMLYVDEEDSVMWNWFRQRCNLNREIRIDNGFLIPTKVMSEYYIGAFRSYIEFEYYDRDPYIYDQLMDILGIIISFVDIYSNDPYICISTVV